MFNTIILLHGAARLTNEEYKKFKKMDTIYGDGSCPVEFKRWTIDKKEEALKELKGYKSQYRRYGRDWDIKEYALEYCECDEEGEFVAGSDYDWIEEEEEKMSKKTELKVFISQPMCGYLDNDIIEKRNWIYNFVSNLLNENKITLVDSYKPDYLFENPDCKSKELFNLGEYLKDLACADIAFFPEGYTKARGCIIEHKCAEDYGTYIIIEELIDRIHVRIKGCIYISVFSKEGEYIKSI